MLYRVVYRRLDTTNPDKWYVSNDTFAFLDSHDKTALFNHAKNITRCKAVRYMKRMQLTNKALVYRVEPMT